MGGLPLCLGLAVVLLCRMMGRGRGYLFIVDDYFVPFVRDFEGVCWCNCGVAG